MKHFTPDLHEALRHAAQPLTGHASDYDGLIEAIGDARIVLIGEATHGTHEFYRERARITQRLIREKAFQAVAVEADWPDAYRLNRYVRGLGDERDEVDAFSDFERFPTWMWRNRDMLEFVSWLRAYNESAPEPSAQIGLYGLDLYSLYASIEAVVRYLDQMDPPAARRARRRYACFGRFPQDGQAYGLATAFGAAETCESEVVAQLVELRKRTESYADGALQADESFFAEQNARVIKSAEGYYRAMFHGDMNAWNLRDRHMFDTLLALDRHLGGAQRGTKIVVWAHNSHLGDARATEMGRAGEINVGQLARERYGADVVLIGMTTHHGTVTAAPRWNGPVERVEVQRALAGSYESLLHATGLERAFLNLRDSDQQRMALPEEGLERAIGVVYRPSRERESNYYHARLVAQFDLLLHFDETTAVEPFERRVIGRLIEPPETYPSGI